MVVLVQLFATGGDVRKGDLFADWKHAFSVKFVGKEAMLFIQSTARCAPYLKNKSFENVKDFQAYDVCKDVP